jgi:hypothetical protein
MYFLRCPELKSFHFFKLFFDPQRLLMKFVIINKDIRKENRTKILIKKRKFKKSLFNAKIFKLKLLFF